MPHGERSGKEGSGVPRGQRKEAGAQKREISGTEISPPPTERKVLSVEEGSGASGRPWHRAFAIAKVQGRQWLGYKGLGTR